MGWVTNRPKSWEIKNLLLNILSLIWVIPFPVHFFPVTFLIQANKAKVESWKKLGVFFLLLEVVWWIIFGIILKYQNPYAGIIIMGFFLIYIVGNIILCLNAGNYLNRIALGEKEQLYWINSFNHQEEEIKQIDKANLFIDTLVELKSQIENITIQNSIDKMIHYFSIIKQKDKAVADKFLVLHSTVLNVLVQYNELEDSELKNEVAQQSKEELVNVIKKAVDAFEQELTNQFKSEILEVSAETDAYIQQLKNKNLIDNK